MGWRDGSAIVYSYTQNKLIFKKKRQKSKLCMKLWLAWYSCVAQAGPFKGWDYKQASSYQLI